MAAGKGDIFDRKAIAAVLPRIDMVAALEPAFAALSAGGAQLAAVGELLFSDPPGDVHVKAGHIAGDAHFVVKVASGFYDNGRLGLPSSSGLSLLFDARTGGLSAILLDDGMLTDERTGGAGAVRPCARPAMTSPSSTSVAASDKRRNSPRSRHCAMLSATRRSARSISASDSSAL